MAKRALSTHDGEQRAVVGRREDAAHLKDLPSAFEARIGAPPLAAAPRKVVVLMRHGDRTMIPPRVGALDLAHLESAWERLMPTLEEQDAIEQVPVQFNGDIDDQSGNAYGAFVGVRPWGQLTSRGVAQCKAVGAELKRRYPAARIRAFSTNFPRTKQSAAAVLIGFEAKQEVAIIVRSPSDELLLPNFDGRCRRYKELRASLAAYARQGRLRQIAEDLKADLTPILGENPLELVLDFRPLCIHEDTVGVIQGIDWTLMHRIEQYHASIEAVVHEDVELVRLASGRLLQWIVDLLAEPGHEVLLMLAHDNMLTALLVALGIFRQEWPIYASAVVLECAGFDGEKKVRVHVNNEVRRDWTSWNQFVQSISSVMMTTSQYESACKSDCKL